ncbi:related to high-affinity phosphate permease, phosphate-repressible [Phialocephala subalpina]|uniref:Related to high-affinity phosphate permease, phosphate-repressible n=1 Tax=Phialocephala subalpina TaxID=576137 RepID=A0A1L7WCG3_9HELO|nr:related to high-affinity phosphate permease, phosphate-repressible [Phialocephala subalpina]
MSVWGFKWLKFFLNPFGDGDFDHISEEDRRAYIVHRLETAKFKEYSWVVVVAGVGFFTDAYSIFAINMVVPILGIIYYGGNMPHNYEIALSVVTLGGSIIGQIAFGLGADLWGRRKMYGQELIITIGATLGVVMASNGIDGSIYPLSAVICSEFAPTRMRGKMLTVVFACQPLGQLAATLVTLIAVARQRDGIPSDATLDNCNDQCKSTLDSIWRWIIGVGVIPAVIALWFRLTIIESPRYTADVSGDTAKAASELKRYLLGSQQAGLVSAISVATRNSAFQRPNLRRSTSSGVRSGPPVETALDTEQAEHIMSRRSSGALSVDPIEENRDVNKPGIHPLTRTSSGAISIESGARSAQESTHHDLLAVQHDLLHLPLDAAEGSSSASRRRTVSSQQAGPGGPGDLAGAAYRPYQDDPEGNADFDMNRLTEHPPKQYFMTSTGQAFPGMPMNGKSSTGSDDNKQPPPPSWEDFKDYFWHKGNLRTLIATSVCWFCLDLPFYGLGMNSPKIITKIWYGKKPPNDPIYTMLVNDVWQSLVVVSLGAIVGISITFVAINRLGRKWIQMIGFFWLFILFIVIGGSFYHLYEIEGQAAIVVLYILCQIFFNFGPNATTYIMPAELFPTRYRGLCHGISAAFGKLGSVVAQLFLAYINYGHGTDYNTIQKWLPYSLLIFSIFMLLGLYTTIVWIPGQEHSPTGSAKTLEQWAKGRSPEKDYSDTRWGKVIERIWKWCGRVGDRVFMFLDGLSGGEEAERRNGKNTAVDVNADGIGRELDEMGQREMEQRGRSGAPGLPQGDGMRARGFVNGSIRHAGI